MKSTHSGHCQACGRLQKLPNGLLSLHGYTIDHGYFSGTCVGAKARPFELSCDLVKSFIDSATKQLDTLEAFQKELRLPALRARVWVRNYEYEPITHRNSYRWREVDIIETVHTYPDSTFSTFSYIAPGPRDAMKDVVHKLESDKTIRELATKLNRRYAEWLEHEADSLRRYIAWQTERVRTWRPAALLAHDAKDAEGFEPTKASY